MDCASSESIISNCDNFDLREEKSTVIDTGRVQFGASLSWISPNVFLVLSICYHSKSHEFIQEKANTNHTAASVNITTALMN